MRILLPLGFALLCAMPSPGATIITNLSATGTGAATADGGFEVAVGFTMPAGVSYNLTSATFRLQTVGFRSVSGSDINVKLFGDSGGNPVGPALATFTHPADFAGTNAEANEFVTPLSSVTLLPSLTYWLVVGDTATSGFFGWEATAANTYSGIATYAGARQQQNNDPPQTSIGCCLIFQIDATPITGAAVPEPSTLGICSLGLFVLVFAKRRLG